MIFLIINELNIIYKYDLSNEIYDIKKYLILIDRILITTWILYYLRNNSLILILSRPEKPIEFVANYLIKNNPENSSAKKWLSMINLINIILHTFTINKYY